MEKWIELGKNIRKLVNTATFPVGISFLQDASQIPAPARRPYKDLKVKMAPCQGTAMARLYGWTVAFGKEDIGCAIAGHTYGWERLADEEGAITFFTDMNYVDDETAARNALNNFRLLDMGEDLFVAYAPLERTKIEPDVVLIYANPAQMMRLIHGATQKSGTPIEGSFSGRAASCTEGVIGAYLDKAPKVVVPGNGDRVWAGCQDHEMVMAVPASRLSELVQGLEKTHRKGIRYPIPTYLRFTPEVAFTLPLSDIFKPEERHRLKKH